MPRGDSSKPRKKRVKWTEELEAKFLAAVADLEACDPASVLPMNIYTKMNTPGLTRENIASHLQLYRARRRQQAAEGRLPGGPAPGPRGGWLQQDLSLSGKISSATADFPRIRAKPQSPPGPAHNAACAAEDPAAAVCMGAAQALPAAPLSWGIKQEPLYPAPMEAPFAADAYAFGGAVGCAPVSLDAEFPLVAPLAQGGCDFGVAENQFDLVDMEW